MIFFGRHNCYISFFADDTNLFCLCKRFHRSPGNSRIARKRFDINKLSLNLGKTKLIVFGNKKINADVQLKINEAEKERVNENTFLGAMKDHKLNWKSHINHIKSKISKSMLSDTERRTSGSISHYLFYILLSFKKLYRWSFLFPLFYSFSSVYFTYDKCGVM